MSEPTPVISIEPHGDLILNVRQNEEAPEFRYRVSSQTLQESSRYFENLLSGRFSEGQKLSAALEALKLEGYATPAEAPEDALPVISIVDVGRISKVSSIQNLFGDFLRVLHGQQLAVPPPIANLANLAVVADRFDALPFFSQQVQKKRYIQAADAKTKKKAPVSAPLEERVRQKLLIGLFLDNPNWVTTYSKHLIIRDSVRWKPDVEEDDSLALWWDIPGGVEDEMIQRREYILETINSLQSHFLKLYTSGERQCRLGYDSSPQCDAFQLGEMVRFFLRLSTLRLQGTIYDPTEPTHYVGDIDRLLESLRQASSYQIDRNHAHCGLRVRIIPLLDFIQNQLRLDSGSLEVGICADCWNSNRLQYAWSEAKRPVLWTTSRSLAGNRGPGFRKGRDDGANSCLAKHVEVRDMFTATERDWTAREA